MKIDNKKILNIFTMCILIVQPIIYMCGSYLQHYNIISNRDFINSSMVFYFAIPFLIYIYIKEIKETKRKLDIFDYIFYTFIIVDILSVIFSIDKNIAIFGIKYRHEGFLSVLTYNLLFINWKNIGNIEDIKKYIKIFIIIALVESLYGYLQIYSPYSFILKKHYLSAYGFCGHPNFFGSLIVTVLSIITCSFLMETKNNIKKSIIIILLFISLINTQSTGPFGTYVIIIILMIIYLIKKKKLVFVNIFILFALLIPTYLAVYSINTYAYKYDRCELCNVTTFIKKDINTSAEKISNGRFTIWKNTLEVVKKYPITGVGFDNLKFAYPNNPKASVYIDNAHNVYLHRLVTTGILGFIPYLILCLITFIIGLKSKEKGVMILLCGFVAYSIQAFANISVITVAPIYYIIIGLILSSKNKI